MRTQLRKIGNSKGVIIPASLLKECGIEGELDLSLEDRYLVLKPVQTKREGWFENYKEDQDDDVWKSVSPESDSDDWEW
ncbi:MAG: hypothetical protein CMI12_12075 [Oceanospirillum sp.]|nr:hypothetical protein [Oceanospirillum sp.]